MHHYSMTKIICTLHKFLYFFTVIAHMKYNTTDYDFFKRGSIINRTVETHAKEEPNSYRRIAQALERDSFHSGRGRGVSKFSGCLSASFSRRSRAKHQGN